MRFAFWRKPGAPENPALGPITGNFTLTAQLAGSSGRSVSVAGYIYDAESAESLNARMDVIQEVIERQRTRCEIPELEAKREQMVKGLEQARDVLAEMEQRRKNGERLTSNELLSVQNMRVNIKKVSDEIDKGAVAIAEAKKKAGVGG